VAGRVLVVGSTEEQVTLLAEVEDEELQAALAAQLGPVAVDEDGGQVPVTRRIPVPTGPGALAGSVLDKSTWTSVVQELRERTVRH